MTFDDRFASRKFILTYALLVVALVLVVLLDKDQFKSYSTFSLEMCALYFVGNVATKAVTKPAA